jgi:hypothetical protein
VHASCHPLWLAEREGEARRALGLEAHSAGGLNSRQAQGLVPNASPKQI